MILIIISVVLLLVGLGIYYYTNTETFDTNKNTNTNTELNHTADLMYFFTDWCPHCKKAKPEWAKITEYLDSNKINNYNVHCIEYDCSKQTPDIEQLMDKYQIEGYPTIKLRLNGNIKTFDSNITYDNVIDFLKQNID
jgi:thiol-disulfide isomerase/thioredoxin